MTGWLVDWTPIAENQLADIWLHAPDRATVTAAEDAIERMLARDPLGHGREVLEGLWKLTVKPLTVYYVPDAAQGTVEVQAVAYTP